MKDGSDLNGFEKVATFVDNFLFKKAMSNVNLSPNMSNLMIL
jgi:hypothetical protein